VFDTYLAAHDLESARRLPARYKKENPTDSAAADSPFFRRCIWRARIPGEVERHRKRRTR
jgi:hypothetical protein